MHLKQLVLKGFKSFADRSVITLEPGISAIVGPNGSGKSNISDAVLWVLGERNAKNLRGQVMEDVIFAGSSARKSVSVAEVELVLDNSDGTLPVEYDEVSIARRMYRNGESDYLINGSIVRRMDVLDVLHDTGLGTGTHSIIAQGHLESILQSHPEDRRALIEEAAGVLKHKQRKEKSQRKLEQMDQHLARVNDVVAEVTRQLGPLERKAKRAIAYKQVSAELADVNLKLAVDDLRIMRGKWEQAKTREAELQEALAQKQEAVRAAEAEAEGIQDAISMQNATALQISQKQRRAATCSERFRSAASLLDERRSAAIDRIGDLERAIEDNRAKREAVFEQYDEARAFADGLDQTNALNKQAEELLVRIGEAREVCEQREAAAKASKASLEEYALREQQARESVNALHEALSRSRAAYEAAQEGERAISAEIKALEALDRAASAAAGAARSWVLENNERLEPLTRSIKAEQDYESLVERLLGSEVNALVADDMQHSIGIGHELEAQRKKGEVVLFAKGEQAASPVAREALTAIAPEVDAADAFVALIDKLSYPAALESAVIALLGDVVVCPGLDEALAAWKAFPQARYVTRGGAMLAPGAKAVFGAPVVDSPDGVLARTRRQEDLRGKLDGARAAVQSAREEVAQAQARSDEARKALLAVSEELASMRGAVKADERESRAARERVAALEREAANIERQKERVAQQAQAYAQRIRENRERELERLAKADEQAARTIQAKRVSIDRVLELLPQLAVLGDRAAALASALDEQAIAAQEASDRRLDEINAARAKTRAARDAYDAVSAQLSDIRIEKGRLDLKVESAVNAIVHDCGTSLEAAMALPELENREEAEALAFKLRRRITNMGTINPDAAEEYDELKVRSDYLLSQLEDLRSARASLARIDRVIDARMKDDFANTFKQVDENFQRIFETLFPGGSGRLVLVDPQDLENTGVEVVAQPYGKRITKMTLMSGGEKSLVALALLFAVYATRSTPFYILDEVEAALDDTNLRRLGAYLNDLRSRTQLIMITHQRRTMEMADVLFGVSMQADGVTRVVSQRLDRALEYAE